MGRSAQMWNGTGLCVYAKRLKQERLAVLWRDDDATILTLR
jgi:hypothetical protein